MAETEPIIASSYRDNLYNAYMATGSLTNVEATRIAREPKSQLKLRLDAIQRQIKENERKIGEVILDQTKITSSLGETLSDHNDKLGRIVAIIEQLLGVL